MYADVIIPLGIDNLYTYFIPERFREDVKKGSLVVVSFVGGKRYTGVVYALHTNKPEGFKVKAIDKVVENGFGFSELHFKFLSWIGEYYMSPMGEVLRSALPLRLRLESNTTVGLATDTGIIDYSSLTTDELKILNLFDKDALSFTAQQFLSIKEIEKCLATTIVLPHVESLLNKGLLTVKENVDDFFKPKQVRYVGWAKEFMEEELHEILDSLKRASVQYNMLSKWILFCEENGIDSIERKDFLVHIHDSVSALKTLCDKGILKIIYKEVSRIEVDENDLIKPYPLSEEQQTAYNAIKEYFRKKDSILMQGVTSSGKTEIYIHLIKDTIDKGKQVIYLLPEIALTVQIVKRLKRVFGDKVGIYHSGMPDNIRAEIWRKQNSEEPFPILLGVRSSIFLPYKNLGLIIIDEEHEPSYKQKDPNPRYQGRDAAIMLGKLTGAKILLGSATPSFESYQNVLSGKYGFVRLDKRYGNVLMPQITMVDVAEYRRKKIMKGSFSPVLKEELQKVLDDGKQIILFQNRRGYSTFLQCNNCGSIPKCKRCDVSMTYYKYRNELNCHYCGSLKEVPNTCTECGQGKYVHRTPGTEKVEEEIRELFPDAKVARMDLDIMTNKAKYQILIDDFESGEVDILIGTQMVSKGLDFENVKLVGVIDADSLMSYPDFRSEERAYDMLMQVSGRSGRKGEQGKVIIQTMDIKNRLFKFVKNENYEDFFHFVSTERKVFNYPPFSRLIQIELRGKNEIVLRKAINDLATVLRKSIDNAVYGPSIPEISKIKGLFRVQILIKTEQSVSLPKLKSFIKSSCLEVLSNKEYRGAKAYFDVDPY